MREGATIDELVREADVPISGDEREVLETLLPAARALADLVRRAVERSA